MASLMQGVFPRDRLPFINIYPSGLIANTDPHGQPGTHWVAMYFESSRESELFDSYGFSPETYNMDTYILGEVTYHNDKPLQGLNSDVCGIYCLFYLIQQARNVDMNTVQAKFKGYDSQWKDAQIVRSVHVVV